MSVTVRDIVNDADAFKAAYPHWPHPEPQPGRSPQGDVSTTANPAGLAQTVPLSGDPFERHAITWHDGARQRVARFNTDDALARCLDKHGLTLGGTP